MSDHQHLRAKIIYRIADIDLPGADRMDKVLHRAPIFDMDDDRLIECFEDAVRDATLRKERAKKEQQCSALIRALRAYKRIFS